MPTTKVESTDPALEAQVFWLRYRREIAALLVIAIIGLTAFIGYRLYHDRREMAASAMVASAKTAVDYQEVINRYRDTSAAGAAYLLLADTQRKDGKFADANNTLQTFIAKFPEHELVSTARMAMAANLESLGKQDDALAMYQVIGSLNAGSFNAPHALLAQAQILEAKNRAEEARRVCETIMTKYRDSYAALEAARLLRTLKPAAPQTSRPPTPAVSASPAAPSSTPAASPAAKP